MRRCDILIGPRLFRALKMVPLLSYLFFAPSLRAQVANVQDSLTLVEFYNSTGGPQWINNSGWLKRSRKRLVWCDP